MNASKRKKKMKNERKLLGLNVRNKWIGEP